MSELKKLALAKAPMYLDDRSPEGHIIVCTAGDSEHSFFRPRLGLSVECPVCGQIALSVDLIAAFYKRLQAGSASAVMRALYDEERP